VVSLLLACSDDGEPAVETSAADDFAPQDESGEGDPSSADGSPTTGVDASTSDPSDGSDSAADDTTGPSPSSTFAELCAAPGVLFCDDFEGGWDETWIEDGGDVRIVAGAAVDGEGSEVVELATYDGQQSSKLLWTFPGEAEIHVRFDVQYDAAYDNTGGSHGPILGGSASPPWGLLGTAGIQPNGSDHFVLNFEPIGTIGQGGELGFYAYFVNMMPDGNGDYWGNVFESELRPPPVVVPGQWHCAEYGLVLNTPGETTDGRAEFWFDGVQHGDFDGFQWRTAAELQIDTFVLDSYNHFNDGPLPARSPNLVRYDNVVISTQRVGCL